MPSTAVTTRRLRDGLPRVNNIIPFALVILTTGGLLFTPAHAQNKQSVIGENGSLTVYGSLTESACRLEMESARQDVQLGNLDTAMLQQPGDHGRPVSFQLRLKDCVRGPSHARDTQTGDLTWSTMQPSVSVYFSGVSDDDAPDYIKVRGAGGLALRLMDSRGHLITLSPHATPLLISPGMDQLTYTVTPIRTVAPLRAGAYQASIGFRILYD